jgi:hypothetical protein
MVLNETKLSYVDSLLSYLQSILSEIKHTFSRMQFLYQSIISLVNIIFYLIFIQISSNLYYNILENDKLTKWERT